MVPVAGERGLQRLRWTGRTPFELKTMHLTGKGFELTFTLPMDSKTATDPANYAFKRYFYSYHKGYGSPQREVQAVKVASASMKGESTVFLELDGLEPGRVYELKLGSALRAKGGESLVNTLTFYNAVQLK